MFDRRIEGFSVERIAWMSRDEIRVSNLCEQDIDSVSHFTLILMYDW